MCLLRRNSAVKNLRPRAILFLRFVRRVLQTHEYLFNQRASIVEKLSLPSIDGALNSIRVSSEWNI